MHDARRVVKALNSFLCRVEDLCNPNEDDIHAMRLKIYTHKSLDEKAILSYVFSSETGMPVSRLLKLVKLDGSFCVAVRWKGLSKSDDTLEPLRCVYKNVPRMVVKLVDRANTPPDLRHKASATLGL